MLVLAGEAPGFRTITSSGQDATQNTPQQRACWDCVRSAVCPGSGSYGWRDDGVAVRRARHEIISVCIGTRAIVESHGSAVKNRRVAGRAVAKSGLRCETHILNPPPSLRRPSVTWRRAFKRTARPSNGRAGTREATWKVACQTHTLWQSAFSRLCLGSQWLRATGGRLCNSPRWRGQDSESVLLRVSGDAFAMGDSPRQGAVYSQGALIPDGCRSTSSLFPNPPL